MNNIILYLLGYKDFKKNFDLYIKKVLFDIEKFIIKTDMERKKQLLNDMQAKELLLWDDCYIIPKELLNNYITRRKK